MSIQRENINQAKPQVKYKNFSIRDIKIDYKQVEELDIFESLVYPGITGSMLYRDYTDILERNHIFAGDEIDIDMSFQEKQLHISKELYAITGYKMSNTADLPYNQIFFTFETKWSVEASTQKLHIPLATEAKPRRIDQMIKYIVEDLCGGEMGIVVATKGVYENFCLPSWTLIDTLNYLMNFASSDDTKILQNRSSGGYCLWTDLTSNKVNFTPIDYLAYDSTSNKAYADYEDINDINIDSLVGYNIDDVILNDGHEHISSTAIQLKIDTDYPDDYRHIRKTQVERSFDIIDIINNGAHHSKLVGFNYDENLVMEEDISIDTFSANHMSLGYPIPNKYLPSITDLNGTNIYENKYRTTRFSTLYPNTKQLLKFSSDHNIDITPQSHLKGRLNTRYTNLFADQIKINTISVGDPFSKKVGRQLSIDVPSAIKTSDNKTNQLSGTYIVRNNRHRIKGMYYINIMTLMADGFKNYNEDPDSVDQAFVKWIGSSNI